MVVMIFASVVDKSTGGLPLPEEYGRRSLAVSDYYGSWQMLQKDIRSNKSALKTSSAKQKKTSETLKTVTEEFTSAARRVRNENIQSGLKISQEYEVEIRTLRDKYKTDEEHTSDLLHELYEHKKLFDANFDTEKEAHDYERETVVGEIEKRLNKSHEEYTEAESKLNADEARYDLLMEVKKLGRRVVQKNTGLKSKGGGKRGLAKDVQQERKSELTEEEKLPKPDFELSARVKNSGVH
eukprot:CAMPEP_0201630828 /NCGR_PEP_ID=MMETSP0493-20130528/5026_1 /ASSEMBLY_ACC=CAM_ASM_000838 /TAXON_ID=420259 /ORGANISM="Thalassiosira gravida, Strain GMp14c1" /LENGTH=238 /DNA_ID=CAMNT_0048102067 /DNA_START=220 /DNA_END=937 /DNA_ORIENTATION=+